MGISCHVCKNNNLFVKVKNEIDALFQKTRNSLIEAAHVTALHVTMDVHSKIEAWRSETGIKQLWWMLGALVVFHISEFLLALRFHGRRTSIGSFLISGPYLVAFTFALVEHAIESQYTPWLKTQPFISYIGLVMVVVGELLRKSAVLTAHHNFTHDIKKYHQSEHQLITHGIYRFVRHPGYLGFFIWSVGTQVLLCNPVCTVGYVVVTWRFFNDRIPYEEYFLRQFFGEHYEEYAQRVPSGLPLIK